MCLLTLPKLRKQGRYLLRIERGRTRQSAVQGRVGHVHARIDDGNDHPLALLRNSVGAHHHLGAEVVGILGGQPRRADSSLAVGTAPHSALALKEGRRNAIHSPNRFQRPGGCAQRNTLQGMTILVFHRNRRVRDNTGHGLANRGKNALTLVPLLETNDNPDELSRVFIARRAYGFRRDGLAVLRGQRCVGITDRQGRGRGSAGGQRG